MGVIRMDNVAVVVDDLDAAVAFFAALGLELEGSTTIEGRFADQTVGIDNIRTEIVMMRTPDGRGRVELTRYLAPPAQPGAQSLAPNTLGLHRMMFAVDDIEDTIARLAPHGAQLLGELARYEDTYLLCYLRGPSGIIVALAQQIT